MKSDRNLQCPLKSRGGDASSERKDNDGGRARVSAKRHRRKKGIETVQQKSLLPFNYNQRKKSAPRVGGKKEKGGKNGWEKTLSNNTLSVAAAKWRVSKKKRSYLTKLYGNKKRRRLNIFGSGRVRVRSCPERKRLRSIFGGGVADPN